MEKERLELSDHDLLVVVYTRQEEQIKQFSNHLRHHWMVTITALSAAFVGTGSFLVGLILLLIKAGVV